MRQRILQAVLFSSLLLNAFILFVACDGLPAWFPIMAEIYIGSYSPTAKNFFMASNKDKNKTKTVNEEDANAYVCTSADDWKLVIQYQADVKKAILANCSNGNVVTPL